MPLSARWDFIGNFSTNPNNLDGENYNVLLFLKQIVLLQRKSVTVAFKQFGGRKTTFKLEVDGFSEDMQQMHKIFT